MGDPIQNPEQIKNQAIAEAKAITEKAKADADALVAKAKADAAATLDQATKDFAAMKAKAMADIEKAKDLVDLAENQTDPDPLKHYFIKGKWWKLPVTPEGFKSHGGGV
jgi:cell division septum initiation protein DivIVA